VNLQVEDFILVSGGRLATGLDEAITALEAIGTQRPSRRPGRPGGVDGDPLEQPAELGELPVADS
jgi:hypothetical protein